MDLSRISDVNSEAVVIATLIYHPEFIMHTDYLKPGYFYNIENGCIYWAISELYKNGIDKIDALNISTMLDSNKAVKRKIEEHNMSNMQEFIDLCSEAARDTLEEYKLAVNNVVTTAFKRDMAKAAVEAERICLNENLSLSEVNKKVNDNINDVIEKYIVTNEVSTLGEKLDDIWDEIEGSWNDSGFAGLPSMIPELNNYVTYDPSELILISGRMKTGKSAFMLCECINMLKSGVPVLYIDTEISDKLFTQRVLSCLTGISGNNIKNGRLSQEDKNKLKKARDWLKKQPLVHEYMTNPDTDKIYAMCKILKHKIDIGFVVYDYIKCDDGDSNKVYNILGQMTDFLKNKIAGELYVPVLAGAQLNRNDEIADSDKIYRYVSTGLKWRPKTSEEINTFGKECGNYALIVDINRNGDMMSDGEWIDVVFDGSRMRIQQAKEQHVQANPFSS
jgi:replicative DNA helicase